MPTSKLLHPVTIRGPIVLLPADEYRTLLAEAGYVPTPKLTRQLAAARSRFRKGLVIPWEQLRRDLR
jgi:hypothetical protein